jgi:hypothetical protein
MVTVVAALVSETAAQGADAVFHLDFSRFMDVSANNLAIEFGDAVSLVPGGGPTLSGGRRLDAARWEGVSDATNQIIIFDNPILDGVAVSAGSIVSWIKVDDENKWNNIAKTPCVDNMEPCGGAFGELLGIEFQANAASGVFGAVQGWATNNFGPAHSTNGGPGGTETPTDVWTHAALTWNDVGDHTIYVNGQPGMTIMGVGPAEPFGQNNPGDWTIGGDGCCGGIRYLDGELADFAIFDVELTQNDILEIVQSGVSEPFMPEHPGDANGDQMVDFLDFEIIRDNFKTGTTLEEGDVTGDRKVDFADFRLWKNNFDPGPAAVPEPSCVMLVTLGIFSLFVLAGSRRDRP